MGQKSPKRAVSIGGGCIGLEMADARTRKGMEVSLLEFAPEGLTTLDPELGVLIRTELESNRGWVITGQAVQRISRNENGLSVRVDIVVTAIYHGMAVRDLCNLDLPYTPSLSSL